MRNTLATQGRLNAVSFAPRAFMGCGGWDLARAPETAALVMDPTSLDAAPGVSPTRMAGIKETLSVYGGKSALAGARRAPQMGCGDEPCEECAAKAAAEGGEAGVGCGLGCPKCRRIRKKAMMNDDSMGGSRMGQGATPSTPVLVGVGLGLLGLFYLATR